MAEIVKALILNDQISITAISSTDITQQAVKFFALSPVATAALGRTLAMTAMMGRNLKGEDNKLTAVLSGGGDIGVVCATADSNGNVKGYVTNPNVESFLNNKNKLDVGRAVGANGSITVITDIGLKEPYVGSSALVSGEIAEDFAYYFATSQQTPTAINLGVLVEKDGTCSGSGGIFCQVLPFAEEQAVDKFEEAFGKIQDVSKLFKSKSASQVLQESFSHLGLRIIERSEAKYVCDCSRDKIDKVVVSLSKTDIDEITEQMGMVEVLCQFCNKKYHYTKQQAYEVCKIDGEST